MIDSCNKAMPFGFNSQMRPEKLFSDWFVETFQNIMHLQT